MPLGDGNLRTLYGLGAAAYTATGGKTITNFAFGNISNSPLAIIFLSDGSIIQLNTETSAVTTISGAGTIVNPTAAVDVSQWGNQYILIVAPQTNGYFIWDGTLLYQAGTISPTVEIQSDGYGLTSVPSVTAIGGTGSGSTYSVTIANGAIQTIKVTGSGSGYTSQDVIILAFSGGGGNTTATAQASIVGGSIASVSITNAGTGYTSTSAVQFLGGGGLGAAGSVVVSGGSVSAISITNAGQQYTSLPTIWITDANNAVPQAFVPLMPFGIQGTAIEIYQGRVWIANGFAPTTQPPQNLVTFSAPDSPADFNPGNGAGVFESTDSFLRVGVYELKQSNGFLYLVGDSSLNYISGVTTSGNPPITTFQNQNVDPQIGSPWPETVQVFSRNVVFANTVGVYVSYGGAVTKVSNNLDGIYTTVAPTGNPPSFAPSSLTYPSAAIANVFGITVYILLLPIIDQVTGVQINKLLMWDGKAWWTANQEISLVHIGSQEINSQLTAWGTDGTSLYPLFQLP